MDINVEGYTIRKWYEFFEEACSNELGMSADGPPVAKFGVGAVIQNPYAGRFSKDLSFYTMGGAFWEFGQPDWDHTKMFMLFGVAEDHDSNPIKMGLGKLKKRGAKVVGVNPIRTGYNAVAPNSSILIASKFGMNVKLLCPTSDYFLHDSYMNIAKKNCELRRKLFQIYLENRESLKNLFKL